MIGLRGNTGRGDGGGVLYVTAETPLGSGEVWALHEMISFRDAGYRLRVAPRSTPSVFGHAAGKQLSTHLIRVPLASARVFATLFCVLARYPAQLASILAWAWRRSVGPVDFAKQIVVIPKALEIARQLAADPPDHIHAQSTTTVATIAAVVATALHVPWSFIEHTSALSTPKYRRRYKALLERAAFMRTLSTTVADSITALLGSQSRPRIEVIPIGVRVMPEADRSEPGFLRVVTPAMLVAHKGHRVAIGAALRLKASGRTAFEWLFLGEGPMRAELEAEVERCDVADVVRMPGLRPNDQLLAEYASGEVAAVVLPSVQIGEEQEGIPHALLQAMSFGIPVVATDSGATGELVGDGAGVMVPQRDAAALAAAVGALLDSPSLRLAVGRRGQARVREHFDERRIAKRLWQAFVVADMAPATPVETLTTARAKV